MRDVDGNLVGFRLRADGFKYTLSGSNNGFFIPKGLKRGMHLVVVEGPTDAGAALAYGLNPIGRPNNNAMTRPLACLLGRYHPKAIDLMIDHDPDGSKAMASTFRGAESLKCMLNVYANRVPVRIVRPKHFKDLRKCWHGQCDLRDEIEVLDV
jgi:hypothetical protein